MKHSLNKHYRIKIITHKYQTKKHTNIKGPIFEHSNHQMYKYQRADIRQLSVLSISPPQIFECSNIEMFKYSDSQISKGRHPTVVSHLHLPSTPPSPPLSLVTRYQAVVIIKITIMINAMTVIINVIKVTMMMVILVMMMISKIIVMVILIMLMIASLSSST